MEIERGGRGPGAGARLALALVAVAWAAGGAAAQAACGPAVTVAAGDTLSRIAARCGVSVARIVAANRDIDDPDFIRVGQRIRIPGAEAPAADTASDPGAGAPAPTTETPPVRAAEPPAGDPARAPAARREPVGPQRVVVSPSSGRVGTDVQVEVQGFPPDTRVRIGLALPGGEEDELIGATTDFRGRATEQVKLPEWVEPGRSYVVVVASTTGLVRATSPEIRVHGHAGEAGQDQPPDGRLTLVGTLTDSGVECRTLETDGGEVYTLTGRLGNFRSGDRVRVRGTVPDLSTCMQGTTLVVDQIEPAGEAVRRLRGTLMKGSHGGCPFLRTGDGAVYTLVGDLRTIGMGERVYVEGVLIEHETCDQGDFTLRIRRIERSR